MSAAFLYRLFVSLSTDPDKPQEVEGMSRQSCLIARCCVNLLHVLRLKPTKTRAYRASAFNPPPVVIYLKCPRCEDKDASGISFRWRSTLEPRCVPAFGAHAHLA